MKKKLFKTHLLTFAAFCGLALTFSSCANEDVVQGTTGTENDKNLTTFVAGDEAKTRTSMDYTSGDFYWEAGDYIYVKDDDGTWQKSSNAPTNKVASFKFKVPGKFTASTNYKVYYPGKNGSNDQVTISATQTQATPNTTKHFGESGDCGTADATGTPGGGVFSFRLDHQAAILVFQPYTSNTILQNCYLTKVEVSSDNDITDTYTLNSLTGTLTGGSGTGKKIELITTGSGTYTNGFPLNTTSASVTTNGAYMLIKPGTHKLKIRYWLKDIITNIEGTITKALNSFTYAKNTYYDMTANLDTRVYDGYHYYMWDAQQNYWAGHEWNTVSPWQPTLKSQPANSNYPQAGDVLNRYYNTNYPGYGIRNDAMTSLFQTVPNVNEMVWYAMKGEPRRDSEELWTLMGNLYKGGVWLLKKDEIASKNYTTTTAMANTAPDGLDWRIMGNNTNNSLTTNLPSASEADKFFYLPALGHYSGGQLFLVGWGGGYWSSSAYPWSNNEAYRFHISGFSVSVYKSERDYGVWTQKFE